MFQFISRKIISKKWLFLALLIGNILLVGITASNPMYMRAINQRTLMDAMEESLEKKNAYPALISVSYSCKAKALEPLFQQELIVQGLPEQYGVSALMQTTCYQVMQQVNEPVIERDRASNTLINLSAYEGLENHVRLLAGRMPQTTLREDGVIEVLVHQNTLLQLNLLLNEQRILVNLKDGQGNPCVVQVVGIFDVADQEDVFWVRRPSLYTSDVFMDFGLFRELFMQPGLSPAITATWQTLLDYEQMQSRQADEMYQTTQELKTLVKNTRDMRVTVNFETLLSDHILVSRRVQISVLVLQIPVYVLLAIFIFMVSRQIIQSEESEIAVLKSRGVKNSQIFTMYLLQSVLMVGVSLVLGIPLGEVVTRLLGSANGFLEFVSRRSLTVETDLETLLYALAAAFLSVCAMVMPAVRFTRATIVTQKQKKHKKNKPLWQKAFLDVILLGVALYVYYSFNNQKDYLLSQILSGASPDPLLLLGSSLFIMGAGLLAVRLIPLPIHLIFHLFRNHWSPALYASFLQVLRKKNDQNFMMVFLVMTIALGLFNAQTARSMNSSAEKNARYVNGAEITLTENWESRETINGAGEVSDQYWKEPDFKQYMGIDGVVSAAKVYQNETASVSFSGGALKNVQLMGINSDDFGRTAWFDPSLLPIHWYNYLNAMAQNPRAVLVSADFRDKYGCHLGDTVTWSVGGKSSRGVIYGFVEYFPGYAPTVYEKGTDGLYRENQRQLIVANLSQVQSVTGITPYSVWLRTEDNAEGLYRWIEKENREFASFTDIRDELVGIKQETMLLSLNGVLTVSFIVALVLCLIGFMIYWILSIRQRTLLFGIYQAMGLTMRELASLLLNEQLCISLTSIGAGFGVGILASRLYMPMVRMSYMSNDSILPLETLLNRGDVFSLLFLIGVMLLLCLSILVVMLKRMKIFQALKLGED